MHEFENKTNSVALQFAANTLMWEIKLFFTREKFIRKIKTSRKIEKRHFLTIFLKLNQISCRNLSVKKYFVLK